MVGPGGTTTFGYDGNGNMTSMVVPGPVTTTYGYDYENRLVSVTNPSYTAAYTYSGDGLRLRVQESNNPYPDRYFQYDGVRPVLEGTLSGDTYTTLNRYVLEGNSYYDPLISASIGGSNRYYLYDGLGSTRQLLDSSQTVTDTYLYEAFGNSMGSTGSTPNPYKYVGSLGYYEAGATSLLHVGSRHYLPSVGRWMSQDPLQIESHAYQYCGASPANFHDPSGLMVPPWSDQSWVYHVFKKSTWDKAYFHACEDFVAAARICLSKMGYDTEYGIVTAFSVKCPRYWPLPAAGWTSPFSGNIYIAPDQLARMDNFMLTLIHEAQHDEDMFIEGRGWRYTHRHPKRSDEAVVNRMFECCPELR